MSQAVDPRTPNPGQTSLLATKLFAPRARQGLVARPRLTGLLHVALQGPLTLISAPAGFGKTTLVAEWRASEAGRELPLAWVSLDRNDVDPVRFWTYVVAALQSARPGCGKEILALLRSPQPPPQQTVVTALINELADLDHDLVIALDDFHAVASPPITDALGYLVDNLPPLVHMVILTRADPTLPLARWRARGVVAEIRADDLRFTDDEAAVLLTEAMGLALRAEDVAALEARTEGWAAGLQMAALSLRGREDVADFIRDFAGSNRFVLDFLAEEVLSRQSPDAQAFLLRTSILERLCGPLCNAVMGEPAGGDGQSMLERLERANLFLFPLDEQRRWYRYHHLFAEVLRNQLERLHPDSIAGLHVRASEWYEREGMVDQALNHATAARDHERAARLIAANWMPVGHSGQAATVLRWLGALPRQLVQESAVLSAAYAWILWLTGNPVAVEQHLDDAARALAQPLAARGEDTAEGRQLALIPGGIAALRSHLARHRGDVGAALRYAEEALALAPDDAALVRGHGYLALAHAYRESGQSALAVEATAQGIPLVLAGGNTFGANVGTFYMVRSQRRLGRLREAAKIGQEALRQVEEKRMGVMPALGLLHLAVADVLLERNRLAEAELHLAPGAELAKHAAYVDVSLNYGVLLARLRMAQGDARGALAAIVAAQRAVREAEMPLAAAELAAHRARLQVELGELAEAGRWAEAAERRPGDDRGYTREVEGLTIARVLMARGEFEGATQQLSRLLDVMEVAGEWGSAIQALVLRALAQYRLGDGEAAVADLRWALALGQPEGYLRVFLDEGPLVADLLSLARERQALDPPQLAAYADELRDLLPHSQRTAAQLALVSRTAGVAPSPSRPALVEPLSERELDVLRLIAEGCSNQEIAERLVVTINTVKKHTGNLFGKLGVASRTQAIAKARDFGLL